MTEPDLFTVCGSHGHREGPDLPVAFNRYVCGWCEGRGHWNTDGERCMNCAGTGVTDTPTAAVDLDGNDVPVIPLPRPPAVMKSPCVDCAYRSGSPEEDIRPGADQVFFCHHGMQRVGDGYQAAAWVGAMPLGYMVCAGWWAQATGEAAPERPFRDPGGSDRTEATPPSLLEGSAPMPDDSTAQPGDSVDVFEFSTRVRNALYREQIRTVADLTGCTADDILDIRNLRMVALREVRTKLGGHGLALRGEEPPTP